MKKAFEIAGRIISAIILCFSICVMIFTVVSVNTIGGEANFFGYKPYIVLSDSMQDTFSVGDLSVSQKVDSDTLEVGDIVTFKSIDPNNYGEIVTHRIREITQYNGGPAFITYGTTTGVNDSYPVPFENVVGEYKFRLPKMGYFFNFLKSTAGYFTVILLPFLRLITLQAIKFFNLLKQLKKEQQEDLNAQKAAIEAERQEVQRIKKEMEQLKAQLEKQSLENENKHDLNGGAENVLPQEETV